MKVQKMVAGLLGTLPITALLMAENVLGQVAPKTYYACYVPLTGTVYRIKEGTLKTACTTGHVEFSWTDGADAVRTNDALGGDLSGVFSNANVVRLLGRALATTEPMPGQVLSWTGTQWTPTTPSSSGGASDHGALSGLGDDDHPQYVLGNAVRNSINGFAVTGTLGAGSALVSGAGVRLMWYPGKAAIRAGHAEGTEWDDTQIGFASTAFGLSTRASGPMSTALGTSTIADGFAASAFGMSTRASGDGSMAFGHNTFAQASTSTAFGLNSQATAPSATAGGDGNTASGLASTAFGRFSSASGEAATALGNTTVAQGTASLSFGRNTKALANFSTAGGDGTTASGVNATALGSNTTASGGGATALGVGTVAQGPSSLAFGLANRATGALAFAGGDGSTASGRAATALGFASIAAGDNSVAIGVGARTGAEGAAAFNHGTANGPSSAAFGASVASGGNALAAGDGATASGGGAFAFGSSVTASGSSAIAMGLNSTASGSGSVTIGDGLTASGDRSIAMGLRASTNGRFGAFVFGDGSTFNAGTIVSASTDDQFVVRAKHFWLGTSSAVSNPAGQFITTSTGAFLSTGGAWTNASDVALKNTFADVDANDVLNRIAGLRIRSWSYNAEDASVRHVGPTAQDFRAAFGLGNAATSIATVDADGVSLLGIQALEKRTRELESINAQLLSRIERLEAALKRLENRKEN